MKKNASAGVIGAPPEYPLAIAGIGLFDEVPARVSVGNVEFDSKTGFTLSRTGDLFFHPQDGTLTLETITGHSLKLFDFDSRKGNSSVAIPYSKMIFDGALLSTVDLTHEPGYLRWKLPCNHILDNIQERPASVQMEYRTVTNVRARNRVMLKGSVRSWSARIELEIAYMFRGDATGTHHIEPLVSFHTVYRKPRPFQDVWHHERQLRDFLDFVWMRDHDEPHMLLWTSDGLTRFSRKHRTGERLTLPLKAVTYSDQLVLDHFNVWLNKWLTFPVELQRALQNVLRIIRYPMVITDLRMAMALHAFEAMHELQPGKKNMTLLDRLKDAAAPYFALRRYGHGETMEQYFARLVEARNQVIHLRHKPKSALVGIERTRATYEMLVVVRAMILELLGSEQSTISAYCTSAFAKLGQISFKYDTA